MIKSIAKSYISNARKKRADFFLNQITLHENCKILDLGGGTGAYLNSLLPADKKYEVYVADILNEDLKVAETKYGYKTIVLNEAGILPFADQYFDIVFCNSVIEHVTLDKDDIYKVTSKNEFEEKAFVRQTKFANEIRRIGKQYFVQTPNRYFILEAHSWFINVFVFLSRRSQIRLINTLNKFWPKKTAPDWNLLTISKMKELFPEARILPEKSLGLVKSWIAIKNQSK